MLKMFLRVLIALTILTALAVGGLYFYNLDHTYYNEEDEIGNTPGNLYNGGLFAEQDGQIYFSNEYAGGALYVMSSDCTNIRKLSGDKAVYINVDENYVYYLRANDYKENIKDGLMLFNNSGVYRINQNGSGLKNYTGKPAAYLMLKGNQIYFHQYDIDNGFDFYQFKIDETENRLLQSVVIIPSQIANQELIYVDTADKHKMKSLGLSSYTTNTVFNGSYQYPLITKNYIYYIDLADKNKLYRMNLDGSNPIKLVNHRCSTYNITNSGKYLYYQINEKKEKGLYRLNLETMKEEYVQSGAYKQIHVTNKYVFFKDTDNTNIYFLTADGDNITSTFSSLLAVE